MLVKSGQHAELSKVGLAIGLVHVGGPGVPPGSPAVGGLRGGPFSRKSAVDQLQGSCSRPLPLTPEDAARGYSAVCAEATDRDPRRSLSSARAGSNWCSPPRIGVRVSIFCDTDCPRPWGNVVRSLSRNRLTLLPPPEGVVACGRCRYSPGSCGSTAGRLHSWRR